MINIQHIIDAIKALPEYEHLYLENERGITVGDLKTLVTTFERYRKALEHCIMGTELPREIGERPST